MVRIVRTSVSCFLLRPMPAVFLGLRLSGSRDCGVIERSEPENLPSGRGMRAVTGLSRPRCGCGGSPGDIDTAVS